MASRYFHGRYPIELPSLVSPILTYATRSCYAAGPNQTYLQRYQLSADILFRNTSAGCYRNHLEIYRLDQNISRVEQTSQELSQQILTKQANCVVLTEKQANRVFDQLLFYNKAERTKIFVHYKTVVPSYLNDREPLSRHVKGRNRPLRPFTLSPCLTFSRSLTAGL